MKQTTRHIGLSLGADLCWPQFYEDILDRLGPVASVGDEQVRFEVERITIEPFDLGQHVKYDVVLDRLTPWYHTSREWIKKAVVLDDLYVLNDPFTLQAMQKHTSYVAMMRLGVPVPRTYLLPPKEYDHAADLEVTLERYAQMFDLQAIGEDLGYPLFIKPYDGGAWVGVSRIDDGNELQEAYDTSGTRIMHLQKAVDPFDLFVRCLAVGPQVNLIRYDPDAPIHDRYKVDFDFVEGDDYRQLVDLTLTINSFFGWDFNSCEALRKDGLFYPIDFANANPDSQVTSLHFHIPWLVKALIRWSLFCAATDRPMLHDRDWREFFAAVEGIDDYGERLAALGEIAHRRFDTERFEAFCSENLGALDEAAYDYFGTDRAKGIVRRKVEAMFPDHEVDHFTEHFWGLIQFWRKTERDRLDAGS